MSRVKGGVMANKRRKKILAQTKGYIFGRSTKTAQAIEAIHHAHLHSFAHRKDKKNDFRRMWTTRLSAGLRAAGLKYSVFMKTLKDKNILLNRKMLAQIADQRPETFERFLAKTR